MTTHRHPLKIVDPVLAIALAGQALGNSVEDTGSFFRAPLIRLQAGTRSLCLPIWRSSIAPSTSSQFKLFFTLCLIARVQC
jgi:hypothetical protein